VPTANVPTASVPTPLISYLIPNLSFSGIKQVPNMSIIMLLSRYNWFGGRFDYRYGEAVAKASSIMRDNPTSIIDNAVFWIEFVVRHGGAPHLRTAANQLYWFQYYMLDVIAAAMAVLALVSYLNFKCLAYLLKKIFGGSKRSASKVSKLKKKRQWRQLLNFK